NSRSLPKNGRASSGSSVNGGTVISPRNSRASKRGAASSSSSSSRESGATPLLAASPPTLISISTLNFWPSVRAAASSFSANFTESTESTAANNSTALPALLDCKWPIMCHSVPARPASAAAFPANSCTRFSPNRRNPAAWASRIRSGGWVLLTAISLMSLAERPARCAAAAMRSRMAAVFSAMDIKTFTTEDTEFHGGYDELLRDTSYLYGSNLHDRRGRCRFVRIAGGRGGQEDHKGGQARQHDHSAHQV